MSKLSIIIPCYNCEKTLEEAVESIYKQNLSDFEIIMVDDKSTDNTVSVMKNLSQKYSGIKNFFNSKNSGGGATRNRAVNESSNEIIFCLDSDDLLEKNTLPRMLNFIEEKKCDAVCFSKSIKFKGQDKNSIDYIENFSYINEEIPVKALFEDHNPLYSVCMFTKESFLKIGGYPTQHGFDTQGFAFRFLLNGLKAYACPQATYLQRVKFNKSYYLREYESGKVNHNWYHVLEEFLYLFDYKVQKYILKFDLNNPYKNIYTEVRGFPKNEILKKNYRGIIGKNYQKPENVFELYWFALKEFKIQNYLKAKDLFEEFIRNFPENSYVHFYLKKCCEKTGLKSNLIDEKKIKELFSYKKYGDSAHILTRVIRKIKKIVCQLQ